MLARLALPIGCSRPRRRRHISVCCSIEARLERLGVAAILHHGPRSSGMPRPPTTHGRAADLRRRLGPRPPPAWPPRRRRRCSPPRPRSMSRLFDLRRRPCAYRAAVHWRSGSDDLGAAARSRSSWCSAPPSWVSATRSTAMPGRCRRPRSFSLPLLLPGHDRQADLLAIFIPVAIRRSTTSRVEHGRGRTTGGQIGFMSWST